MKELTIEQKAKAYDKAFRIAQELYNDPNSSKVGKGYVCTVFPEVKESKNERIRKRIIALVDAHCQSMYKTDCLDWLEKQCEKKIENEIEIPFGAKDSELQEATYYIPKGFRAEINGNKIIIKKKVRME